MHTKMRLTTARLTPNPTPKLQIQTQTPSPNGNPPSKPQTPSPNPNFFGPTGRSPHGFQLGLPGYVYVILEVKSSV